MLSARLATRGPLWHLARRLALVAAVAAPVGCRHRAPEATLSAAVVDGEAIALGTFEEEAARSLERFRRTPSPLPPSIVVRLKESVLSRMIDDVVLAHKAQSLGLKVTEEEIDGQMATLRGRFAGPEAFAEHLTRTHQTEGGLRQELMRNMLQDRVVGQLVGDFAVAEADVVRYYEENLPRFKEPEAIRARRLVLRVPKGATAAKERAVMARADKLATRARHKPATFGALAQVHSEGPEREAKGDMGGFFPRGRMSPAFDAVAFDLTTPLEISDPFTSPEGVEVVQLLERRAARTRPYAEVEAGLRASLTARAHNDRRREVLQQMRQAARIERLVDLEEEPQP